MRTTKISTAHQHKKHCVKRTGVWRLENETVARKSRLYMVLARGQN